MNEPILEPQDAGDSEGLEGDDQVTGQESNKGDEAGKEGAGEAGDKGGDDTGGDAGDAGDKAPTLEEQIAQRDSENQELRSLLRDSKRDIDALNERIKRSEEALDKAGLVSEEDKKVAVEQQEQFQARENELDVILEMTRLNPKYEDVDTVVSQANFDAVIAAMASEYATKSGMSKSEAADAVEGWVWSLTNPYRFMYDKVKELHPSYNKSKDKGKKPPAEAPGSLQNLGSGASDASLTGWTSAKIEALPEDELQTVPKDVYAKYLRNELK